MAVVEDIRAIGVEAGLVGLGVCAAAPFADVADSLAARVDSGMAAGMSFTFREPERSSDVRASFPWAERLVVGAWCYLEEAGSPGAVGAASGAGRIARFATEDHYRRLRAGLGAIAAALRDRGHRAEVLVDDNRLVDRGAAVRAGIGWWGKNTMVLAPRYGPWLLLGSVVTDAALPTSEPMRRDCGTCAACLPACPTGALVEPGVLDARRCLAWWSQAPGPIPAEYRAPMGDRLYGCDDCLDACPPGRRLLDEQSVRRRGRVDVVALLGMDDRTLLDRYAHFYIPRRQARYLRRNALVVLGNTAEPECVGVLAGYLGHPDWLLRLHAAWALGRVGSSAGVAALARAGGRERHEGVAAEIAAALEEQR